MRILFKTFKAIKFTDVMMGTATIPWCIKTVSCWLIVKILKNVCDACKKMSVPIEWADSASWSWCNDVKWCGTALEGSGTREGEKVLSNINSGAIWLDGVWSWQPKFLVGPASVTVGGSFCQERRTDNRETVSENEQQTDVISERNQKRWAGNSLHNEARKGRDERLWLE